MPCNEIVRKKAEPLKLKVPADITEQEVRDTIGAVDHEDTHRILDAMGNFEFSEFLRKLWEKRKKKRAEVTARYIELQAGVA